MTSQNGSPRCKHKKEKSLCGWRWDDKGIIIYEENLSPLKMQLFLCLSTCFVFVKHNKVDVRWLKRGFLKIGNVCLGL